MKKRIDAVDLKRSLEGQLRKIKHDEAGIARRLMLLDKREAVGTFRVAGLIGTSPDMLQKRHGLTEQPVQTISGLRDDEQTMPPPNAFQVNDGPLLETLCEAMPSSVKTS